VMVGISREVQKRIKTYYSRESEVIYPPFTPLLPGNVRLPDSVHEPYFLVVSRLVLYKRVDLAVKACTELGLPLIVIGTGSEESALRRIAGPSVLFLGNVSDELLAAYFEGSQALLFPGVEDFGLTVVEAQSFGKPVIAFKAGGALETIIDGKTGIFFPKQNVSSLKSALQAFESSGYAAADCMKQVEKFSEEHFRASFQKLIDSFI
jgi:glycosyltransferase involved in cell wall biosynthesis